LWNEEILPWKFGIVADDLLFRLMCFFFQAGVSVLTILLYYYYGGMVLAGLGQWDRATEFFQNVSFSPDFFPFPSGLLSRFSTRGFLTFLRFSIIWKQVLSVPSDSSTINAVAVFAYWKFILVSLLAEGKVWCCFPILFPSPSNLFDVSSG
jgi:hypothetical protein